MENKQHITKDMLISDIVKSYPQAVPVIMSYGLHCVGCHVSQFETLEQGCQGHGMPEEVIDKLVDDLNDFIEKDSQEKK